MFYSWIKKFLFKLDPEVAHKAALLGLDCSYKLIPTSPPISSPRSVMGLNFPNPIGLAAGFDKNGDCINGLASLGFGFIEIGTVTPLPQGGNPKPRLFRLAREEAIINRMGFNNKGIDHLISQVSKASYKGILGINIGKNKDTRLDRAIEDYVICFRKAALYASYITVNISSPNTPELRGMQHGDLLSKLLHALKREQTIVAEKHKKHVPLVVKIAPDLTDEELEQIAKNLLAEKIDGVIATNTTTSRDGVEGSLHIDEAGGLSGKPLGAFSTDIIKKLYVFLGDNIPIIASGGVMSEKDVLEKLAAGAVLVQVYSGLIYRGPGWIKKLVKNLK